MKGPVFEERRNRGDVDGLVRLLEHSDMRGALQLKAAASWNQPEQDWNRRLQPEPMGVGMALTLLVYGTSGFGFGCQLAVYPC